MNLVIRMVVAGTAVLVALAAGPSIAPAQPPAGPPGPPPAPPAVSPYLNLARRGTPAGINYYGLVRPEMEFRNAYQGLQNQAAQQQMMQGVDAQTGLPTTGHTAVFLNTGSYFQSFSPGLGLTRPAATPAQARPTGAPASRYGR